MRKILSTVIVLGTVAACANMPASAPTPENPVPTVPVEESVVEVAATPLTVAGGSEGSQCLAVDVLANDGAFIRRGTRGALEKSSGQDVFTVDGTPHNISGINYSVKGC